MKEVQFYPEICERFSNYLLSYLPDESEIHFSYNKFLPQMINEIETKFNQKKSSPPYIPKLKLDILFGIKTKNKKDISYVLFEVKYLKQLGLSEYSQLVGYLQVAKNIELAILFLIVKGKTISTLSNDFQEIIRTKNLPMAWKMIIKNKLNSENNFKTGICYYIPNNGIEWINTKDINGLSSFKELAKEITQY